MELTLGIDLFAQLATFSTKYTVYAVPKYTVYAVPNCDIN